MGVGRANSRFINVISTLSRAATTETDCAIRFVDVFLSMSHTFPTFFDSRVLSEALCGPHPISESFSDGSCREDKRAFFLQPLISAISEGLCACALSTAAVAPYPIRNVRLVLGL